MSPSTLRNKSLNLCILLNVTSLLFILPNIVICDGDVENIGVINDNVINKNETKEEKQEQVVDNTIVWIGLSIMYILFGVVLYLVIKTLMDRRRKKSARRDAIKDLENGSYFKKKVYDLEKDYDFKKDNDLIKEEIIKPPPAMIPVTEK
jgi:hypothetical protein